MTDIETQPGVEFVYVDVFASRPLTGAPLTLVTDADGLTDQQMRAIAREFNQSETTFVQRPSLPGTTRRLRSFTPTGEEVYGAGHNALGAWLWLASSGQLDAGSSTFTQHIGDDVLPVHVRRADDRSVVVTMEQSPPVFGAVVTDRAGLAAALGLAEDDLVADRPAQVVSTGAGHLLVPIRDRAAVDRAAPDAARLTAALREVGGEGCYLYTGDTVDEGATAYARFFNPAMGIAEDPATGTAAGPLAALLVAGGVVVPAPTGEAVVVVEQGHSMGRPSRITVTVAGTRVRVSGSGLVVARGTMTVAGGVLTAPEDPAGGVPMTPEDPAGGVPMAPEDPTGGVPMTPEDERLLHRAIELAVRARATGDAPFGSLLADPAGRILAEEHNTVLSDDDISAHPELKLARWAARNLPAEVAAGVTMYTSCQPCGMCTGAIERSGLGRVVYALSAEQLGALKPAGGFAAVPQEGPALYAAARAAVDGYST